MPETFFVSLFSYTPIRLSWKQHFKPFGYTGDMATRHFLRVNTLRISKMHGEISTLRWYRLGILGDLAHGLIYKTLNSCITYSAENPVWARTPVYH